MKLNSRYSGPQPKMCPDLCFGFRHLQFTCSENLRSDLRLSSFFPCNQVQFGVLPAESN